MEFKKYAERIRDNFQGKRVEEKVLRSIFEGTYDDYFKVMKQLINDNIIKPIKRSGPNGLKPTLYKRYQVLKVVKETEDYTVEIKRLHPVFNIEGYLGNNSRYTDERDKIQTIDLFIRMNKALIEEPASINERSFQIFDKEKFIRLDSRCKSVFNYNERLEEFLNMYYTPEPFFEHSIEANNREGQINILIIENKDTWYTFRKLLNNDKESIYGIRFNSIIFGEGKKITRKKDSLTEFARTYYKQDKVQNYYYFGDLDMEGIGIFENVVRINPNLNIKLLKEAYVDMIDKSKKCVLPECSELQIPSEGKEFFAYFTDDQVILMKDILKTGKYIPQEILPYGFLKER